MGGTRLRWHTTTLDGRQAAYGDAGDGPTVVLVHGWGLGHRTYGRAIEAVAAAGHRVVAPALPGFGRSAPLDGRLTFERLAWWVAQVCEHAGVRGRADLIGHSLGGGVATATAVHHPDLVRSLTLVNAVGGAVWRTGEGGRDARHLADRPLWHWALSFPREFRRRDYRRLLPAVARDLAGNALRNLPALRRAAHLARTADLRAELAALADAGLPVTVLWGDRDSVIPEAAFAATCDALGATGEVVEGRDHSWLLADPEGFGEVLRDTLGTVHARPSATHDTDGRGSVA